MYGEAKRDKGDENLQAELLIDDHVDIFEGDVVRVDLLISSVDPDRYHRVLSWQRKREVAHFLDCRHQRKKKKESMSP